MASSWVIVGPSGAGKTTIGTSLAQSMQIDFVQPVVGRARGTEVSEAEIYVKNPADAERVLQHQMLQALDRACTQNIVVELSPSALLDDRVVEAVLKAKARGVKIVALDASLSDLARRVGLNAAQPGDLGTPRAWFRQLHGAVIQSYLPYADIWFDTSAVEPEQVIRSLLPSGRGKLDLDPTETSATSGDY